MREEFYELWDEKACWVTECGFIALKYTLENVFYRFRFFFAFGRKMGTGHKEGLEVSFEYGCVFWVVCDLGERRAKS